MNLKKSNGVSLSHYEDIKNYVIPQDIKSEDLRIKEENRKKEDYKRYLHKQIEALEPDVIVCCGDVVLDVIKDDKMYGREIEKIDERIYYWKYNQNKEATLINYVHPSIVGVPDDILFYGLSATFLKSLDIKNKN